MESSFFALSPVTETPSLEEFHFIATAPELAAGLVVACLGPLETPKSRGSSERAAGPWPLCRIADSAAGAERTRLSERSARRTRPCAGAVPDPFGTNPPANPPALSARLVGPPALSARRCAGAALSARG